MLQIFLVTYLVLGLPAVLILGVALVMSNTHKENDQQRYYQIALAVSSRNARREYELAKDSISFEESELLPWSQRTESQEPL